MTRPAVLPVQIGPIPPELQAIPRWVLWKYVERTKPDGSKVWAKLPMTTSDRAASSTKPATWTTFEDAVDTLVLGDFDGIGLVLGDDVQGVDLDDCRDPETGELSELAQEVLARVEGYAEVSPSGTGIKLFSRTNLDASRAKKEVGVELYREGRYFTVTGHAIPGRPSGLPAETQDLAWLVERVWGEGLSSPIVQGDAADLALALYKAPLEDWDLDRVEQEVLPHLNPDCGYGEWLAVGAALHHQGEGDEAWLELWDAWSQGSAKWVEGVCAEKWSSFHEQRPRGRGAVTLASLLKQTADARKAAGRQAARSATEEFERAIADCSDPQDLQDQVAARIANTDGLDDIAREKLAQAIQKRSKDLGLKLPIGTVRGLVKGRSAAAQQASSMPDWARQWVYITDVDRFFNRSTKEVVTSLGFRAMFNRQMPVINNRGDRASADRVALEQWELPTVSHKAYMPGAGEIFEMFGRQWVNLYRPESAPTVPDPLTAEDEDAIAVVQKHFELYLPDPRERALLLSWIAHNVQRPGKKVRWSPYVCGVEGDGKSFFAELVGVAMGGQNVRMLNGSTLESNFTDWAGGYALVAIEEMKQHGHNRYDVMNRIKPYISNSQVEIHPKGKASYTAPNVANYIIFSNHLDGAPIDENDRRYMFVRSPLSKERAKEMTERGYFRDVFDAIHGHAGAIRGWLLGVQPHPEFDPDGRAPHTSVKNTVVEMSKSDLEIATEDLLETGADGVSREVISSAHLTRALTAGGQEPPAGHRVNALLTRLGFQFACRKKWHGEACRVWLPQGETLSDDDITDRLNRTLGAGFLQ